MLVELGEPQVDSELLEQSTHVAPASSAQFAADGLMSSRHLREGEYFNRDCFERIRDIGIGRMPVLKHATTRQDRRGIRRWAGPRAGEMRRCLEPCMGRKRDFRLYF
jgi:hypothetical protein